MRLAGPVVAHDEQPLVIHGLVELKLGNDEADQLLGHLLRDDIGLDELPGGGRFVRIPQLNHGFDRFELNQIPVFHRSFPSGGSVRRFQDVTSGWTTIISFSGYRLYSG